MISGNGCHLYELLCKLGSGDRFGGARATPHADKDVLWLYQSVRGCCQQSGLSGVFGNARESSRAERGGDPQNDSDRSDVWMSDCARGSV